MSVVAEQYLQIIDRFTEADSGSGELDLEQAGEYLVVAATLLSIKSRSLLPSESEETVPDDWQEGSEFFESLRERLRAYEITKSRAAGLRKLPQLGVDTFSRRDRKALQPTAEMLREEEDAETLSMTFLRLMKRIGNAKFFTITAQPVSIVSFMSRVIESFGSLEKRIGHSKEKAISFYQLLAEAIPSWKTAAHGGEDQSAGKAENRAAVIGGFIAVLELIKRGVIAHVVEANSTEAQLAGNLAEGGVGETGIERAGSSGSGPQMAMSSSARISEPGFMLQLAIDTSENAQRFSEGELSSEFDSKVADDEEDGIRLSEPVSIKQYEGRRREESAQQEALRRDDSDGSEVQRKRVGE